MARPRNEAPSVPETPEMFEEDTFPAFGTAPTPTVVPNATTGPTQPAPEPSANGTPATPARKKPVHTPLSGDLQVAALIDRAISKRKMAPEAAIATLEYLIKIYRGQLEPAEDK
jgi:hypothetical protein